MKLDQCKHWVFDLDGTLTIAVHDFDAIRAELGLPEGQPILEELARLPAHEAAPLRGRLDAMERELALDARPAVGAILLLSSLIARGARLGILTRNTRANARLTLHAIGLAHAFQEEDLIGRDEAPPKPDPAGLLGLLERWSVEPRAAVLVGDFRFDLETGRAAGVPTVHVDPAEEFSWPELTDRKAVSLRELI